MSLFRNTLEVAFGLELPSSRLIGERLRTRSAKINPNPIFVFGNQKSGTTAIAALLAEATGLSATLDFAGGNGNRAIRLIRGETPIAEFVHRNAWAFSRDIVKEPNLTFAAPQLLDYFAQSRAVFIVRNPWLNIRSILMRLKVPGDLPALNPSRFTRVNYTWRNILSGRDLGLPPDHYITILAQRWFRAADIYDRLKDRLVLVRYEDFNADKVATIAKLAQTLELPTTADISTALDTAYQPRANAAADSKTFLGSENLRRIDDICAARASQFGYPAP